MVPKIVSDYVKEIYSLDDPITRSKTRNEIQDISRENQLMLTQFTDPPCKSTEIPTHFIPRKTLDLDIDSLEQGH